MKLSPTTYYVWIGGSCDYGHKERAGGGAYIVERVHALDELPEGPDGEIRQRRPDSGLPWRMLL